MGFNSGFKGLITLYLEVLDSELRPSSSVPKSVKEKQLVRDLM